jgi:S1-C subfamily serine protease
MPWKNSILYILLVIAIAGISALTGAIAGGAVVYRALQQPANLPAPIEEILPSRGTNPGQTLTLKTTDVQTAITQSVEKMGPTVVTVVGTVPGQMTIFGPTGEQTVSGTGFFITDSGYIITNNHVVEGTQQVNIVLSDGTQQKTTIVGTDLYSEQVQVTLGEAPQG